MGASVKVETEIEKPGTVMVRAVAHGEAINDGRPVAGFFVRRRYDGDRFLLASPDEFSPTWMRFEDTPPKEWDAVLKKKLDKSGVTVEDIMYREPPDPARARQVPQMSMSQMQSHVPHQMDGQGRVSPRK